MWSWGPPECCAPNLLIDATTRVEFLNEIKSFVVSTFHMALKNGILCEEPLRGVRYKLMDVTHTPDAIHRGGASLS